MRPIILGWLLSVSERWKNLSRPLDDPQVQTLGVDPDRVILIGNALSVGYGVSSYDRSIAGHLARAISDSTNHGTVIEIIADANLTAASCLRELARRDLGAQDAIVMTIGVNEALRLSSVAVWSRGLEKVFRFLETNTPASLLVFVVAVPNAGLIARLPGVVLRPTERRAALLNAATQRVVARHPRAAFIPFAPDPPRAEQIAALTNSEVNATSETYEEWAAIIAPPIVASFVPAVSATRFIRRNEAARQAALDALGILDTETEERFDSIVAQAKAAFGTDIVAITLIDNDRQWMKSAVGMDRVDVPRELAFCNTTITRTDQFTIEDTAVDPVFKRHPFVTGYAGIRFYAGVALEAEGQRVGALCLIDSKPRKFSRADAALLRDLALKVQTELQVDVSKKKRSAH
ncbi:GAF domain-containing protein [Lacisediminihabitans sp. H27-G8]|uniref:GAF domain-containing protein n=1 Tax=Lacisediminihabitans sp. H27-G8 TaxID=3111909 RepID=UPI0038FD3B95